MLVRCLVRIGIAAASYLSRGLEACFTVLSQIIVWDEAGRQVGTPQTLNGCFVCAMDIHARSDLLLVGGERALCLTNLHDLLHGVSQLRPSTA